MTAKPYIIDFHTHCFPDALAKRAIATLSENGSIRPYHDGTAAGLVALQERSGVSQSVIMPIATKSSQTAGINQWAAEVQAAFAGKILAFGSLHPASTRFKEEIAALKALGLKGVKLHPEYQNFHVDDPSYYPLYEAVFSAGLPILFHTGGDVAFPPPYHAEPAAVARMAKAFPGATIIAAHLGGYAMWEESEQCLIGSDVMMDISTAAGTIDSERLVRLCRAHGTDKILFATDSPWFDPAETIRAVENAGFTEAEKLAIYSENAKRLLKI